ncbi:hypothetical protein HRbin15_01076 [bacterium HR15]|nr:hypothetical protein HRbin15_01076 [bacterium HR15]
MRVYSRAMGGTSWASVEDYLPAGNALGYNQNWQYRHTGGELLMMGAAGEPSGYYPMDSNGLAVQSELPAPCMCPVVQPQAPMACPPLGYASCIDNDCSTLSVYELSICFGQLMPPKPTKPRYCTPKEKKECKRFCERLGGAPSGCVHDGNQLVCSCVFPPDKPCNPKQQQACEKHCKAQGGIVASCYVDNGKVVVCDCIF